MNTLEQALSYAEKRICTIPLQKKKKLPDFKTLEALYGNNKWGDTLAKTPATPKMVKSWFEHNPGINIGIITGETNKLVVLDLDRTYTIPFLTNIVKSGRDIDDLGNPAVGRHIYFSIKDSSCQEVSKCHKSLPPIPGVNWKINNNVAVAPPSTHKTGSRYEWEFGTSLLEMEPVPFSIDLLKTFYKINKIPLTFPVKIHVPSKKTPPFTWDTDKHRDGVVFHNLFPVIRNPDIVIQLFRYMGIQVNGMGHKFCCPLHPENNPSATLFQMKDGIIVLSDFHATKPEERFWDIGEIYYHHKTGKVEKLDTAVRIKWMLKCFADFGAVSLPEVEYKKIGIKCTDYTRQVYEGFIKLIKVGKLYDSSQDIAPFSWRFAQDWCGVSERKVKMALTWLLDNKFIKKEKIPGYKYTMYSLC